MMESDTYRTINKEIIMEVQKLRIKNKENEDKISTIERDLLREKQENSKLKIFISKTLNSFYGFTTHFSSNYEDLVKNGITGIEMGESTTESNPPSIRSSRFSDASERIAHLRSKRNSPVNSINVCYPTGYERSPREATSIRQITENEENEDPEADRYHTYEERSSK